MPIYMVASTGLEPALSTLKVWFPIPIRRRRHWCGHRESNSRLLGGSQSRYLYAMPALAEAVGFEPTAPFRVRRFSRPFH